MRTKRVFDLFVAVTAAIAWVPVLLGASLMVLLMSGRPVFYRSSRWVRNGEMVRTIKFRTMVKNADKLVNRTTVPVEGVRFLNIPPDSPLYTRPGRILEGLGLTEIPQLIHVLRGEMSIVGNRPLPDAVMKCLREEFPYADDRFLTPAGLTGPVQLVGRDSLSDSERLRIEGAYCRAVLHGYRLRLDFTVLLSTVLIVAHLKKPLDYQGVMDLIDRHTRQPRLRSRREILVEDAIPSSDVA
ncbi:lipopolysaccharide/colanic/teichoic acid biosynthesis glycosyltransferase [Nocardioides sp. J9]|uniref:sugar transferase n=1 Tax=Nocardioides sp. J9 TaxID=935844 RepID=UPI0011A90F74|nr:sugar transferase [Nocardioides sp. J9]TWG91855.1 lipopolysaccharide/colanic/teichoic acid biosynthesis glycosyltransferase [Nocardioides sp. J9]